MGIVAFTLLAVAVVASISCATHLIFVGARDSSDLAAKLAVPFPRRAADWPELRLDAVVVDLESADRVLVIAHTYVQQGPAVKRRLYDHPSVALGYPSLRYARVSCVKTPSVRVCNALTPAGRLGSCRYLRGGEPGSLVGT